MEPIVLFVHAHPDDESIATGGTLAHLVRAGARVVLLTATRGEGGEVIGEEFAHLEGDRAGLAAHREQELAAAMGALGVSDHRFLGSTYPEVSAGHPSRRFEDSGMVWGEDGHAHAPASMPDTALCAADLDEVSGRIAAVIAELDPHLVITYGADGGYGHPDHRRCHDATVRALRMGGFARAERTRLLTLANPPEAVAATFDAQAPGFDLTGFTAAEAPSTIADTVPVAVAQDVEDLLGAKAMAMAAHATQVTVAGAFFALSNGIGQRIGTTEYYALSDFAKSEDAPARALPDGTAGDVLLLAPEREAAAGATSGMAGAASQHGGAGTGALGAGAPVGSAATTGAGAAGAAAAAGAAGAAAGAGDGVASPGAEGGAAGLRQRPRRKSADASWPATLGGCLHAFVVGAVVGLLGSFQHLNASVVTVAGATLIVPWGLTLALLLTVLALWHVSTLYRSTIVTVVLAAVVSGLSFAFAQPQLWPGTDLIVTGSMRSLVWLFAPMVLAAIIVFVVPARVGQRPRSSTSTSGESSGESSSSDPSAPRS